MPKISAGSAAAAFVAVLLTVVGVVLLVAPPGGTDDGTAQSTLRTTPAPTTTVPQTVARPRPPRTSLVPTPLPTTPPSTAVPGGLAQGDELPYVLAAGSGTSIILDTYGLGGPRGVDAQGLATTGADGSGCAPGEGSLPDGLWFVHLEGVVLGDATAIDVDLLCRYTGDNARERFPDEDIEDEFVVNEVPVTRRAVLAPDATFHPGYCFAPPAELGSGQPGPAVEATPALTAMVVDAVYDPYEGAFVDGLPLWLLVQDDVVIELVDGFYTCTG